MSNDNDTSSKPEPVIVRLDVTALNEARSILYDAYRNEPTFQHLFNHRKPGYNQRVRATVRELVDLYFDLDQEAVGVMVNDTLVAVAFIGDPDLRLRSEERRVGKECRSRWSPYH